MVQTLIFRENYYRGDKNGKKGSEYRKRHNGEKF